MTAYLFLLPCLAGLGLLFLYPLVANILYSFTRYNLLEPATMVGWAN